MIKLGNATLTSLEIIVYPKQGLEYTMTFSWSDIKRLADQLLSAWLRREK